MAGSHRHPRAAVTEAHQLAVSVLRKRGLQVRLGTSVTEITADSVTPPIRVNVLAPGQIDTLGGGGPMDEAFTGPIASRSPGGCRPDRDSRGCRPRGAVPGREHLHWHHARYRRR
jgi:hypothetical protein